MDAPHVVATAGRVNGGLASPDDVLTLPFDQYQRYKLLQEVIARLCPAPAPHILDVGGWPGTLRRFLPGARVVVADVRGQLPNMVRADGAALPFADGRFDLVVSSDTLEHVAPERRPRFVRELLRVSRDAVILGAPFDTPGVREAEAVLREAIREKYPGSYGFIEEHEQHGLPDLAATVALFREAGCAAEALPNGYLPHWLPMLALYFALAWRSPYEPLFDALNRYYNATQYRSDNRAPSYRTTIVACRGGVERLATLRDELCAPRAGGGVPARDALDWPQLAALLQAIEAEAATAPREPMRRILELEALVEERTAWAQECVRQLAERDATVAQLRAALGERSAVVRLGLYLRMVLARLRRAREARRARQG